MISYSLGARRSFNKTGAILWVDTKSIEGIKVWVRDEKSATYIRVYEVALEEWVQGEPQSSSQGNFGDLETAKKYGSKAYRYVNKGRR